MTEEGGNKNGFNSSPLCCQNILICAKDGCLQRNLKYVFFSFVMIQNIKKVTVVHNILNQAHIVEL